MEESDFSETEVICVLDESFTNNLPNEIEPESPSNLSENQASDLLDTKQYG